MREYFQSAQPGPTRKKKNSALRARNSSCGKFTANIFSLYGRIRVKTLGIYSVRTDFGKFIGPFLSSDRVSQRGPRPGATRNRTAVVKRSLRRDRISIWVFLWPRISRVSISLKFFSSIYAKTSKRQVPLRSRKIIPPDAVSPTERFSARENLLLPNNIYA